MIMFFWISIPGSLVYSFLIFTVFDINWIQYKKQIVWFTILHSLFLFLLYYLKLPIELIIGAQIGLSILLLKHFFGFSWNVATLISLSLSTVQTLVESTMIHFRDTISPYYLVQIVKYSKHEVLLIWAIYFLLFLIGLFFHVRKISFFKWFTVQHAEYTNYLVFLMGMFLIQDGIVNVISIRHTKMSQQSHDYFFIISIISILMMVGTIFLLNSFGTKLELQTMEQTEGVYLQNIEELISSVRAQRHDYHNHLQVISGLVQRKEYEEVSIYLKELNIELQSQQALLQLNHTSLAALLQAKKEIAQVHNVTMKIDAYTAIPIMEIKSYELVQILGNLLDNAIEEEIQVPADRRMIHVTIDQMLNCLLVCHIHNPNSWIEANNIEKIFQEGYTTKECHKGIGLQTVKRIVETYEGHIEVESNQTSGTTFSIFIPYLRRAKM